MKNSDLSNSFIYHLQSYLLPLRHALYAIQYLFGSKLGIGRILDLLYGAIWRCSRVRL